MLVGLWCIVGGRCPRRQKRLQLDPQAHLPKGRRRTLSRSLELGVVKLRRAHGALCSARQPHPGDHSQSLRHKTRLPPRSPTLCPRTPPRPVPCPIPSWRARHAHCLLRWHPYPLPTDGGQRNPPPPCCPRLCASPPTTPESPILDPSFISTGLELVPGKQSIYGPSLSDPITRTRVTQILGPSIRLLGDPRLPSFQAKADAILRGDGSTIAPGHPVLGCPVGTDAHVESVILASAEKAAALIPILDRLLLSDDSGSYAPDERDLLIRLCVWPRCVTSSAPSALDWETPPSEHLITSSSMPALNPSAHLLARHSSHMST